MSARHDVIIIGAGQAGLACAYYLRRSGLDYLLMDEQEAPGGAWRHTWESLHLFSPARWCSLPGRLMGTTTTGYPHRDELLAYLEDYEQRYAKDHVARGERADAVRWREELGCFEVTNQRGLTRQARAVISATGTWSNPYIPPIPGLEQFAGISVHSAHYQSPLYFAGQRVLVVGEGNSGAQLMAELAPLTHATWVTLNPPEFLPPQIDGRALFELATVKHRAEAGELDEHDPALEEARAALGACAGPNALNLSRIVQVPVVKEAKDAGLLAASVRPFQEVTVNGVVWPDGRHELVDVIIWCTGFRAALEHLAPLGLIDQAGRIAVEGTASTARPGLWLVGYGDWTGFASATLIGVGRHAKATVEQVIAHLNAARAT